jgi:hypothetical protein
MGIASCGLIAAVPGILQDIDRQTDRQKVFKMPNAGSSNNKILSEMRLEIGCMLQEEFGSEQSVGWLGEVLLVVSLKPVP